MTQTELGDVVGVQYTTVNGWEKGKSYPQFQVLLQLREFFDINLERLVYEDLQKGTAGDATQVSVVEFEELKNRVGVLEGRLERLEK